MAGQQEYKCFYLDCTEQTTPELQLNAGWQLRDVANAVNQPESDIQLKVVLPIPDCAVEAAAAKKGTVALINRLHPPVPYFSQGVAFWIRNPDFQFSRTELGPAQVAELIEHSWMQQKKLFEMEFPGERIGYRVMWEKQEAGKNETAVPSVKLVQDTVTPPRPKRTSNVDNFDKSDKTHNPPNERLVDIALAKRWHVIDGNGRTSKPLCPQSCLRLERMLIMWNLAVEKPERPALVSGVLMNDVWMDLKIDIHSCKVKSKGSDDLEESFNIVQVMCKDANVNLVTACRSDVCIFDATDLPARPQHKTPTPQPPATTTTTSLSARAQHIQPPVTTATPISATPITPASPVTPPLTSQPAQKGKSQDRRLLKGKADKPKQSTSGNSKPASEDQHKPRWKPRLPGAFANFVSSGKL
eukprot:TRINITY_DN67821_c5_g7_i8.p1 TRINITY_DN67821_c5_g7~~TRINITY_DN67821_c5_g7_i8.p1  ORF type:complete len:413 (+),score=44.25 TRINITY_DN67821_c5_g7_i8:87-1325(+)